MNRYLISCIALGVAASFFGNISSRASDGQIISPQVRNIKDSDMASLIAWHDRETLEFEKDEIHEKIALRLFELNQDTLLKDFLKKSKAASNLSELNEELILAKVLARAEDSAATTESLELLEKVLSIDPMSVVNASWQGDRSKTISARNSQRIDVNATPELAKQMDDVIFQQFSKSVLLDFNKTQTRAAELLISIADASKGTEKTIKLVKSYEMHPVAGQIFKDWLLNTVRNEK